MNISPFISYTNEHGLPGVKVRQWHPIIFIPNFKRRLRYWLGLYCRYRESRRALREINTLIREDFLIKAGMIVQINDIIQSIDCGYACGQADPYGFVPEDGCPIHDTIILADESGDANSPVVLSSCPFCGSDKVEVVWVGATSKEIIKAARCDGCGVEGPPTIGSEKAKQLWNKRVTLCIQ